MKKYCVVFAALAAALVVPPVLAQTNQPPTVSIVNPRDGATFIAPANILFLASVHDPDGSAAAASIELFEGTNKIGDAQLTDPGPPHDAAFLFYWTNVPPGRYDVTAKVTDDQGATATSAHAHITVVTNPPLPIVTIVATDPVASEVSILTVIDPGIFTITRASGTNAAPARNRQTPAEESLLDISPILDEVGPDLVAWSAFLRF